MGIVSRSASHAALRTAGLTRRYLRAPRCCAMIGVAPVRTPSAKELGTQKKSRASDPAAMASVPIHPIMTTSVSMMAMYARWLSASGAARRTTARVSRSQAAEVGEGDKFMGRGFHACNGEVRPRTDGRARPASTPRRQGDRGAPECGRPRSGVSSRTAHVAPPSTDR